MNEAGKLECDYRNGTHPQKSPSLPMFWVRLRLWSLFADKPVLLAAMLFLYQEMPGALMEIF